MDVFFYSFARHGHGNLGLALSSRVGWRTRDQTDTYTHGNRAHAWQVVHLEHFHCPIDESAHQLTCEHIKYSFSHFSSHHVSIYYARHRRVVSHFLFIRDSTPKITVSMTYFLFSQCASHAIEREARRQEVVMKMRRRKDAKRVTWLLCFIHQVE